MAKNLLKAIRTELLSSKKETEATINTIIIENENKKNSNFNEILNEIERAISGFPRFAVRLEKLASPYFRSLFKIHSFLLCTVDIAFSKKRRLGPQVVD